MLTQLVLKFWGQTGHLSTAFYRKQSFMDKKTLLIGQIIMTFLMAFTMSGIMIFVTMGVSAETVKLWLSKFLIAWPIAFCFTQVYSRIAFPLGGLIASKLK